MLNSKQRMKLRSLAHHFEPSIIVGKHGLTKGVEQSIAESLEKNELIKVKFNNHKPQKKEISKSIEANLEADIVGSIGNIVIFYKQNPNPEKQLISI